MSEPSSAAKKCSNKRNPGEEMAKGEEPRDALDSATGLFGLPHRIRILSKLQKC
jgi:hypothetical protein